MSPVVITPDVLTVDGTLEADGVSVELSGAEVSIPAGSVLVVVPEAALKAVKEALRDED